MLRPRFKFAALPARTCPFGVRLSGLLSRVARMPPNMCGSIRPEPSLAQVWPPKPGCELVSASAQTCGRVMIERLDPSRTHTLLRPRCPITSVSRRRYCCSVPSSNVNRNSVLAERLRCRIASTIWCLLICQDPLAVPAPCRPCHATGPFSSPTLLVGNTICRCLSAPLLSVRKNKILERIT